MIEPEVWPEGYGYLRTAYPEHGAWLDAAQAEIQGALDRIGGGQ